MSRALADEHAVILARRVWDLMEETEQKLRELGDYKKARWERAHAALFELLRRAEGR